MWVNSIVPLSESQFIVFDQEGNLFIFQKNLVPTCIEDKLKLTLKGSYCIGEEVQSATFGSLRTMSKSSLGPILHEEQQRELNESQEKSKVRIKKKAYVAGCQQSRVMTRQTEINQKIDQDMKDEMDECKNQDNEEKMIVTRSSVAKQ